ncbi:MAG: DUF4249 family protein [Candidatus Kapaibacteriota bacterium]
MNKIYLLFLIGTFAWLFTGCEDKPPTEFEPQYYVEAFLIVDQPFDGIKLYRTQPLNEKFDFAKAFARNVDVRIKFKDSVITLIAKDTGDPESWCYFYPDTTLKVQPNMLYSLEIRTPEGNVITSSTKTPERFDWVQPPPDTIFYPKDSINFTDQKPISIRWTSVKGTLYYIVSTICLDTLDYGKYLNPPTDEKNRRVYTPFQQNRSRSRYYYDVSNWDAIPNTEYPLSWLLFKWFGRHKVIIYTPDFNYLRWILQQFRGNQFNPLLSSVNGAIGVFGSASKIEKEIFLIKNQP